MNEHACAAYTYNTFMRSVTTTLGHPKSRCSAISTCVRTIIVCYCYPVGVCHYRHNLINNFSIIACQMWYAACKFMHNTNNSIHYVLTGTQHTLRARIVRVDQELFHQIKYHYNRHSGNHYNLIYN